MLLQPYVQDPNGLSDDRIFRHCPAIFAEEKHESRSSKYATIRTIDLLHELSREGFVPTEARQARSKTPGMTNHAKHLLRLRHRDDLGWNPKKPEVREIVFINSLNGTSSYLFYLGIFRFVCENGLIRGEVDEHFRVMHLGGKDIVTEVIETTLAIAKNSAGMMERIEEMKQIPLHKEEQLVLAEEVMSLRLGLGNGDDDEDKPKKETKPTIFTPQDFLTPRFPEDRDKDDLWTVSNVVQNNAVEGGNQMYGGIRRRDNQRKLHTVRKVRGIDGNVSLNLAISRLTERMRKIKLGLPLEEEVIVEAGR